MPRPKSLEASPLALAHAAAVRLLARREHSQRELLRKLTGRGFLPEVLEPVLAELIAAGHLSDSRFADSLVRHRSGQGYGERWIAQEFEQHGIAPELVAAAFGAAAVDWTLLAEGEADRYLRRRGERGLGSAMLGHLIRRGFSPEIARLAVRRLTEKRAVGAESCQECQ